MIANSLCSEIWNFEYLIKKRKKIHLAIHISKVIKKNIDEKKMKDILLIGISFNIFKIIF